ncbi:DinB family protein [Pedobacter sp. P351]|uniref:DinB family protein n=1 Tax=Pedobacter superstes TaxID=3133441 RepID=UPI0030967729
METLSVNDSRMQSLIVLYDMHTSFFKSALDGISDNDAHNRLNTKANHIAWLTGSLVQQRFELAHTLGIDIKNPSDELFKDNKGIQDGIQYPSLSTFKKDWESISPISRDALVHVNAQKLDSNFEMMPGMNMTYYDLITFIIYREANCIGQIALWRRLLGYEAMKYM